MPNALRTTRTTTRFKFALLALGAIPLSALAASPAAAQNASVCRSSIGVAGDFAERCLVKPEGNLSTAITSSVGKVNGAAAQGDSNYSHDLSKSLNEAEQDRITDTNDGPGVAHYDKNGQITSVDYPMLGFSEKSIPDGILRVYPNGRQELVYVAGIHNLGTEQGLGGGSGGAAGHTAARRTLTTPNRSGQTAAASPKAPTPKSTTVDKATNTMTRDYRTGATAAPGGPPPAAAIGSSSKPSAEQLASQSGSRDHRHK